MRTDRPTNFLVLSSAISLSSNNSNSSSIRLVSSKAKTAVRGAIRTFAKVMQITLEVEMVAGVAEEVETAVETSEASLTAKVVTEEDTKLSLPLQRSTTLSSPWQTSLILMQLLCLKIERISSEM